MARRARMMVFPALVVLLFAYAHAIVWATGRVPFGVFESTISVGVAYGPFLLGILAAANFVWSPSVGARISAGRRTLELVTCLHRSSDRWHACGWL
jgi:hypothetical protein